MSIQLFCDTHVHIYPFYDLAYFFRSALENFEAIKREVGGRNKGARLVLFLTERFDCNFFKQVRDAGSLRAGEYLLEYKDGLITLANHPVTIVPGRQIISSEGLEILCLMSDSAIEDGLPLEDVVDKISSDGGIAILPWAPGKWLGMRGRKVASFLESAGSKLLGDSALRPIGCFEPRLFSRCRSNGGLILAGSDPLPLNGEERRVASYLSLTEGSEALDVSLFKAGRTWKSIGTRLSPIGVVSRLIKLKQQKRG